MALSVFRRGCTTTTAAAGWHFFARFSQQGLKSSNVFRRVGSSISLSLLLGFGACLRLHSTMELPCEELRLQVFIAKTRLIFCVFIFFSDSAYYPFRASGKVRQGTHARTRCGGPQIRMSDCSRHRWGPDCQERRDPYWRERRYGPVPSCRY